METIISVSSRFISNRVRQEYRLRQLGIRLFTTNRSLRKNDDVEDKKVEGGEKKQPDNANAQKKAKNEAPPTSALSAKLIEQILSMKISGGTVNGSSSEPLLNLAKPIDRRGKRNREKKEAEAIQNEAPGVSIDLIKATKDVAANIGGDVDKTKSELLSKLLQRADETDKLSSRSIKSIISGMKIDRPEKRKGLENEMAKVDTLQSSKRFVSKTDIFGAKRLGMFSKEQAQSNTDKLVMKTWDKLQHRELEMWVTHPPRNAFEEEIQWLKQGKVWRFPIDNEQGMDDEMKIGFYQHVFLEDLISDFPKKGPIRHFMELVIVGLSKNPYITVEQKKADIDWFRQYFYDKQDVLKEVGAIV